MTILSDVKALGQQIWLDNLSPLARTKRRIGANAETRRVRRHFQSRHLPKSLRRRRALRRRGRRPQATRPQPQTTLRNHGDCRRTGSLRRFALPNTESTGGKTGFVSPRSLPELAKDAQGTVEEARRLHAAIARKTP